MPAFADPAPTESTSYGLEWPGTGSERRMLYWDNPFPIYDATYIFQVYPRAKQPAGAGQSYPNGYYTTFFWGNNGSFIWDGGVANTYYGAHPYPVPSPNGPGQWEISVASNDYVTGSTVQWDRWYVQAFRAWRESPSITHHEFYWDLPDTSKVIRTTVSNPGWADQNPPRPAIVIGQAPDLNGQSWGGYAGWEEFNGIIRGIQIYSGLLSVQDILSEISAPQSTAAGQSEIWYLNLNPRPVDVSDKKIGGTPHDPSWDGAAAFEWADATADTAPPSTPTGLAVTAVSSSRVDLEWLASSDDFGVLGYTVLRDGAPVGTTADTTYTDLGLDSGTTYSYVVRAFDAAGNESAPSAPTTATTVVVDTSPPLIGDVAVSDLTTSGAVVSWTTDEPSDSRVEFGSTTAYGSSTPLDASLATSHVRTLGGLAPSTTYHYRVESRDAWGNVATSTDRTLRTADPPPGGDITTGLVAYWSFDDGTGTVAADSAGGQNGTLTHGPVWITGHTRGALQFNASDNGNDDDDPRVVVGPAFDVTVPFTIAAWVRPENYADYRAIFGKRDSWSAGNMRFRLLLVGGSGRVSIGQAGSNQVFLYSPPTNAWTHLALVLTPTSTSLYVNGALFQTVGPVTLGSDASANTVIGNNGESAGGDGDPFRGAIDELRIYGRALSEEDVQALFASD